MDGATPTCPPARIVPTPGRDPLLPPRTVPPPPSLPSVRSDDSDDRLPARDTRRCAPHPTATPPAPGHLRRTRACSDAPTTPPHPSQRAGLRATPRPPPPTLPTHVRPIAPAAALDQCCATCRRPDDGTSPHAVPPPPVTALGEPRWSCPGRSTVYGDSPLHIPSRATPPPPPESLRVPSRHPDTEPPRNRPDPTPP